MSKEAAYHLYAGIAGKTVVVFGSGMGGKELLAKVPMNVAYFIDNDEGKWGSEVNGIPVRSPEAILGESKDGLAVIIASGQVREMAAQLEGIGLEKGKQIFVSPLIVNEMGERMVSHPRLLVSGIGAGNGLYLVDVDKGCHELVMEGNCRGVTRIEDGWLVALEFEGILRLDNAFRVVGRADTEGNLNLHGITVSGDRFWVNETRTDTIGVYDLAAMKRVGELRPFKSRGGLDEHHINDVRYQNGELLISMFSYNGIWGREIWNDGRIVAVDPEDGTVLYSIIRGLSQPHSILLSGEEVLYCNSMQCSVHRGDRLLCQLNGYARGLEEHDGYFYIGQSRMLRLSRFSTRFTNIHNECGIHVWDSQSRTSRFVPLSCNGIFAINLFDAEGGND